MKFRTFLGIVGLMGLNLFAQDFSAVANANNSFGFNLLAQIAAAQPGENIFISPFSASAALQMVASGAAGRTKTEMESVLQSAAMPAGQRNESYNALGQLLAAPHKATLEIANSIWYENGIQLKSGFVADNKKYFHAGLAAVDFASPASAGIINNWADKHTHGKISRIVSFPFPPATKLVLAGAIYFKGKWAAPFKTNATQPRAFYLPDGGAKQMPMMQRAGKFNYQETPDFQAVQLPYNGGFRMEIILPATNSSPQKLAEELCGKGAWQTFENGFAGHDGFLALPKFKMNYEVELNQPLKKLGMKQAFGSDANFSGISATPLNISEVKQKSYIAVDEEGTEAAAVTTVTMTALALHRPDDRFEMIVNRPFLFAIVADASQTVLFLGFVNEPKE